MPQKVRDDTFHLFNSSRTDLQYDMCAYYNMKPAIIFWNYSCFDFRPGSVY